MTSTTYQRQTHQSSWNSPSYQHKYYADAYEEPHKSCQTSKSILKTIRKSLCRIFSSRRVKHNSNDSCDSLAYAESNDSESFEAELMDEDNMAWGKPPKRSKRRNWKRSKSSREKVEDDYLPPSPESVQAPCRLW